LICITGSDSQVRRRWPRDTAVLPPEKRKGAMTDIDRYRDAAFYSAKMAGGAVTPELRNIWMTIERSYRFLLDREQRIAREAQELLRIAEE